MLIFKILVAVLILWVLYRAYLAHQLYNLFVPPENKSLLDFYLEFLPSRIPLLFDFKEWKKERDALSTAKILSAGDVDFDKLFPNNEQLDWLRNRIFELYKTEYLASGNYVDLNIQPLWALITMMIPETSSLKAQMPVMEPNEMVNVSMMYVRARDRATAELNAMVDRNWKGYYFDQPMFFWAAQQVNLTPDENDLGSGYRPQYIKDLTRLEDNDNV